MQNQYKAFPPGWNNIRVPIHRRAATLAGIATYTPCVPKGIWGQRAAWTLVSVAGPRLLPGRAGGWEPPFESEDWQELIQQLEAIVGKFDSHTVYERRRGRRGLMMLLMAGDRPVGFVKARESPGDGVAREELIQQLEAIVGRFDSHTVYERRRGRRGLMMLLMAGDRPVGFVKARESPGDGVAREELALGLVEKARPTTFVSPRVLGSGEVAGWKYLVTSPMPPRMHRMIDAAPSDAMLAEIRSALDSLGRPSGTPATWEPFHGDFTPWNLRSFGEGAPWLIDWEDSGFAPPQADETLYLATAYAIGKTLAPIPLPASEAVGYWWTEVNLRIREKLDWGLELRQLDHGLLEALSNGAD